METNVVVDIGDNIVSLLEKLALQIGISVDTIVPWYVKQAYIEGVCFTILLIVTPIICILVLRKSLPKAKWKDNIITRYEVYSMFAVVVLILCAITVFIESTEAVSKVFNPEYHAVHSLLRDLRSIK